jgi:hypothetical protein
VATRDYKPSLEELTNIFRESGAPEAELWAGSQFREGIQQLARFSFLKAAWRSVVDEDEPGWIEEELAYYRKDPNGVGAGAGRALSRLLETGVQRQDITELVRTMQWQTLFYVCSIIDNSIDGYENPWKPDEHWHLVLHKDLDCPTTVEEDVGGLHESVLELDPTGREMRPRPEA